MVCPLVQYEYRLEYKLKSLDKHMRICQELKKDVLKIEEERERYLRELMIKRY